MTSFSGNILSYVLARSIFNSSQRSDFLGLGCPVYCNNISGVKADTVTVFKPKIKRVLVGEHSDELSSDKIEIPINQKFQRKYFIPMEIFLKSDIDVIDICRAYFSGQFRVDVSNAIGSYINTNATTLNRSTTYPATNNAEFLGSALTYLQINDIGNKERIYKYANGAPVVFSNIVNQFNAEVPFKPQATIEGDLFNLYEQKFTTVQDNKSALYYVEKPVIIFCDKDQLRSFYNDLATKTIDYKTADKFDIGYYPYNVANIEGPVVGKADNFAICYTTPQIKVYPSNDEIGYYVQCEIDYGVYPMSEPSIFEITSA